MTGDKEKLHSTTKYKGGRVVVTADNTKLPIKHIGDTVIMPCVNSHPVQLQHVMHVYSMKKNLLFVSQLTAPRNYVLFSPHNVKVYWDIKIVGMPIMEGERVESIHVLSAESAYIEKTRKNDTINLGHTRDIGLKEVQEDRERSASPERSIVTQEVKNPNPPVALQEAT
ncbi:hypothetical protein ACH5RR_029970 [Cinchona calisaya]|uniref:Retrovirus-related Pol polyprotein from transposon TNT 1-94-like beta-barrel domain-containing protein n=1 Tax=Cinchona calisaya TaxID=153742 RepID=A0ABD2YT81_9GENT